MNREIAKQWSAALRSGDYRQTHGVLNRPPGPLHPTPGYCCLGVLCELATAAGVETNKITESDLTFYNGCSTLLPLVVQEWAGLRTNDGTIPSLLRVPHMLTAVGVQRLTRDNDTGYSFSVIADIIDAAVDNL